MTDCPPDDPKPALRKAAFAARAEAHRTQAHLTPRATARLLAEIGAPRSRIVAGYMPIRSEIDVRPAMTALHAAGARIAVPVILAKGAPLAFHEWTPEARMIAGPFGAQVPERGDVLEPDTLIVPLVAFDADLNRLGYGGGFYDRSLAALRAGGRTVRAVGFAYAAQRMEALPPGPFDMPLDAVVTEAGVWRPRD